MVGETVMYFPDLSPCGYFPFRVADQLVAVGWLESGHSYARGDVPEPFVVRLTELLVNPWQPSRILGWHDCAFCRFTRGPFSFKFRNDFNNTEIGMGINNLFIPETDRIIG